MAGVFRADELLDLEVGSEVQGAPVVGLGAVEGEGRLEPLLRASRVKYWSTLGRKRIAGVNQRDGPRRKPP